MCVCVCVRACLQIVWCISLIDLLREHFRVVDLSNLFSFGIWSTLTFAIRANSLISPGDIEGSSENNHGTSVKNM